MGIAFPELTYLVRQHLSAAGVDSTSLAIAPLGHIQQAVAALLGFDSLAAMQAADFSFSSVSAADCFIGDGERLRKRLAALGHTDPNDPNDLVAAVSATTESAPAVYIDEEAFVEDVVIPYLQDRLVNDDKVGGELVLSGGDIGYTAVENCTPADSLADLVTDDTWEIEFDASISTSARQENPVWGTGVDVAGQITFLVTGHRTVNAAPRLHVAAAELDRSVFASAPD